MSDKTATFINPLSKLVAPGHGLLTVTTGTGAAEKLSKLFPQKLLKNWSVEAKKRSELAWVMLGCPSDVGGGVSRGAAAGPLALRAELYRSKGAGYAGNDIGDVPCIPQLLHDSMYNEAQLERSCLALWGRERKGAESVSALNVLADVQEELFKAGRQVFTLGGDHSVSWAPLEALSRVKMTDDLGVLHLDAHTDLMEHRFGVEHCFSTWAAHASRKINPKNWFQLGVRVSRKTKKEWESAFGIRQYWANDVKKKSAKAWADLISAEWEKNSVKRFYVSFDIDVLDPKFAPSTGTPERGGLNPSFVKELFLELGARFPLVGADLVEVAPNIGSKSDQIKTLKSAVDCFKVLLPWQK